MMPVPDAPPARAGTYSPFGIATFVCALTSAPRATSSLTMSGWFSVTAHINAVCARTVSFAFTLAPRSSSSVTASTLPVRAAVISAVSPPGVAVFGIGAGVEQPAQHGGVAVERGESDRRDAVSRRGLHVGAALDQRVDGLDVVLPDCLVQRCGAVWRRRFTVADLGGGVCARAADERKQQPADQPIATQRVRSPSPVARCSHDCTYYARPPESRTPNPESRTPNPESRDYPPIERR